MLDTDWIERLVAGVYMKMRRSGKALIAVYSVQHFCVDFVCAAAMYAVFMKTGHAFLYMLLYNFCAFALQLPFGVVLDAVCKEKDGDRSALACAGIGILLTGIGAFVHPVLLGIGNALFHVGGGVGTIRKDTEEKMKGRGLGVFVAPGAIGLFFGAFCSAQTRLAFCLAATAVALAGCILVIMQDMTKKAAGDGLKNHADTRTFQAAACAGSSQTRFDGIPSCKGSVTEIKMVRDTDAADANADDAKLHKKCAVKAGTPHGTIGLLLAGCMAVVMLRSFVGLAIAFPWKTAFAVTLANVLAVALGKTAGGFLGARIGLFRAALFSLVLSGVCFCFSQWAVTGILAVFFFQMTMPLTLYLLVRQMPQMPGFAFGILTFGLFIGFLPVCFGAYGMTHYQLVGVICCICAALLFIGMQKVTVGQADPPYKVFS